MDRVEYVHWHHRYKIVWRCPLGYRLIDTQQTGGQS